MICFTNETVDLLKVVVVVGMVVVMMMVVAVNCNPHI